MKKWFSMATQGAKVLQDLQKQYPNLSVSEIMKALKKSKGDPMQAAALLSPLLETGTAATVGSAPDLQTNPEAWFKYYDQDGGGLARYEVAAAISETFPGPEGERLLRAVDSMWRKFDPDGSGSISMREFMQPNGLRDTLLAALSGGGVPAECASSGPQCANGCGRKPFKDFPTCCTHCKGPHGPHARSCDKSAAESSVGAHGRPSAAGMAGRPSGVGAPGRPAFRPSARHGNRKALLIGINYVGQRAELKGCVNDVANIQKLLIQTYRWDASCIRTLTDGQATHRNICIELERLASGAQPGDALFFHFSGHGAQQPDPHGYEEDGMNETIIPVDFKKAGMITDDDLTDYIVKPLPEGVRLTAVMDCCHSGTGLDLPFMHTGRQWKQEVNPFFSACDAQLFSGCEDHATSADVQTRYGAPGGAMTTAFCEQLRANPAPSYTDLINSMNNSMKKKGFKQRPQLSSSQAFQFPREFSLTDAVPNGNSTLGRVATTKFKPNPRPFAQGDPLQEMLGPMGAMTLEMVAALGGKKAQAGLDVLKVALGVFGSK